MIRKKYKLDFFGFTISATITRKVKKKKRSLPLLSFQKYKYPIFSLSFLLFLSAYVFLRVPHDAVYPTQTSPLFEKISPLGKDNLPEILPPPKNTESIFFRGNTTSKKIALTFDADMTPEMKYQIVSGMFVGSYNKELVDELIKSNTKATFFLSGMWIEMYPEVTKEFAKNSLFELGNHSYSHPGFDGYCYGLQRIKSNKVKEEITKTQILLQSITGQENKLFRFPGGCYSKKDLTVLSSLGLKAIQWDVVGQDGFNYNVQNIEQNVLKNVKSGSIIVLHMNGFPNSPMTAQALPAIITTLKKEGFEFVKVSELIEPNKILSVDVRDFLQNKL